ncbi:tyrosine--tRNA ligase [Candidatus Nomurabacteria bacterium CG_4_9_14_0_2_um_filter_32_10]|uniref:Tyrosine--tRNA ligase n=3 Tax=Candidatus Nomuraibacteriota TaxID=1752729 RepID=A0A2H0CHT9_9BACT|nr:MAG: tyrosine--tRNA ligase [Candidatus Nomurabacteria bacterium CG22_combo_CG10-13_8_21_14_all_32_8]PIZ85419.1 MAG: tyrosine--tRNA ligase [Candidatus Nomurabacteria bacterium CG_4_10_14_0_2_um_filter_33_9]PJC49471.1 MAG: tyrosine--tRNA ligase [Candidatus Nomurabacteria bacterium CG_4_9_14_0_2_um_filter_32_10]
MKVITDEKRIDEVLNVGVEEIIEKDHLLKALKSGKQLRIKFGIDPTMPDLHLGHSVPLRKLRQFQDLGHKAILIIGDSTATIGDPSGRSETRKILSSVEIKKNMKNYLKQAEKILDMKKTEVHYNSEWLGNNMMTILELSKAGTIQQVLHRSDFKKRIDDNQDITILEMLYPLLQGYDSVAIKADLELGGTDQKFNLLMGRRVQRYYKISEQDILTLPILEGVDGVKKMSKSLGNYIALDEKPIEMFGKIMSVPDILITKYMKLCTGLLLAEINEIEDSLKNKSFNPKNAKMRLAYEIVKIYHNINKAKKAEENFINTFQKREIPEEMIELAGEGEMLMDLLVKAKILSSKGDFRRLIEEGAVTDLNNDKKIKDVNIIPSSGMKFKIGKRKFIKIK